MQIAGVPDRHEPDAGEVNYRYLLRLLDEMGYAGWVGCEYRPRDGTKRVGLDAASIRSDRRMKVLITGGAGFLGQRLAAKLLERGTLRDADDTDRAIEQIVLADVVQGTPFTDPRVRQVTGDISDPDFLATAIDSDTDSIFHLAAVVSGQAEADFDLGMRINVDASRQLLDVCRRLGHRPKFVFASSVAVYGGELPAMVLDTTALTPQSSYGTQKAVVELFVNDYTRKGFIDGRVLRLPTICVRPGRPNAAASSFASGIIREPLNGESASLPGQSEHALMAAVAGDSHPVADLWARRCGRRTRDKSKHQCSRSVADRR